MHARTVALPTVIPVGRLGPALSHFLHLFWGRVVHISFALFDKLVCIVQVQVKVIRGEAEDVRFDVQHGHILQDHLNQC